MIFLDGKIENFSIQKYHPSIKSFSRAHFERSEKQPVNRLESIFFRKY